MAQTNIRVDQVRNINVGIGEEEVEALIATALGRTIQRLAHESLDDTVSGKQQLFTVPAGKRAVITDIWCFDGAGFSRGDVSTVSFGYNADADEFGYFPVVGATEGAIALAPSLPSPQSLASSGAVFGVAFPEPGEETRTLTMTVFGFLIDE